MTKKISRVIILVSSLTLLFAIVLILGSLYNYFTEIHKNDLRNNLDMVSIGVSQNGIDYLNEIDSNNFRITWIDNDGTVLFDSKADSKTMENHADREEFIEALNGGIGEGSRTSDTLSEQTLYLAKKLADDTVIRTSITQDTVVSLLFSILPLLVLIALFAVVLSTILSSKIAKKTVEPLNNLDLDSPLSNDVYDEISPLLHRIEKQNREIESRIDEIKEQKGETEFITENVADGILILNKKGYVISCNKVAKSLLSCANDDYYLNFLRDMRYENLIEDALKGIPGKMKIQIAEEFFMFSASPTSHTESDFSIFLFIHNITEEENAQAIRRQFSANVSHELKTPLTSIMGASELISNGLVKPEDVKKFASNIHTEATRLLTLVQDIIKVSRLDEQTNFEFQTIKLADITNEVVEHLQKKAEKKKVSINLHTTNAKINGVETVVYEMLYNLCDNAISYNNTGGEIHINMLSEGDKIAWKIRDTGIGIPNTDLSRIYERFYRVDKSHSKEIEGTGLGLSIVKNGAKLHSAEVETESEIGIGTNITLKFKKATIA